MQKPRIDDLSKENLNTELWRYFGAEGKYKGGLLDTQFPFVQQLLSGHDCFCVMATGGGKSAAVLDFFKDSFGSKKNNESVR